MSSSGSETEELSLTPPEILEAAQKVKLDTLQLKSQKQFWRTYEVFNIIYNIILLNNIIRKKKLLSPR